MTIAVNDAGEALMLTPQGEWKPAQTAQNPQTGERLAFDGQAWQALKAGSDPKYEWSDVGQAALRGIPIAGGAYEQSLSPADKARAENFDAAHPYISGGAKLAGGAAAGIGLLAAAPEAGALALGLRGATPLARVFNSAVSGAGINAADAVARGTDPGPAALTGGALGAAAPAVARVAESALGGARSALAPVSRVPANTMRVGNVEVPITGPEAAGDVTGQRFIENARQGTLGPSAQQVAGDFDAARGGSLQAAQQEIRGAVGGAPQSVHDAAQVAQEALVRQHAADRAFANAHYENFGQMQGAVDRQAFDTIGSSVRNDLATGSQPVVVDDILTPAASRMITHLDSSLGSMRIQNRATPITAPAAPGTQTTGVTLQGIDQVRKQLGSLASAAANPADRRASRMVMGAFDQHIQNAVDSALYSGDPGALGALQQARSIWSQYMATYQSRDPAGRIVQKMLGANGQVASHDDIARWLYGASKVGGAGQTQAVAARLRDIMGASSPEWQAVRQGLVSKLLDVTQGGQPAGPQKLATGLSEFLTRSGRQLSETMFTTQERALLQQYEQLMQRMTPLRGAVNYSGTAYHLASLARWTADALMAAGGLSVAGPIGLAAGFARSQLAKGMQARAVARQLYNPAAAPLHAPNASASPLERYATLAARAAPFGR